MGQPLVLAGQTITPAILNRIYGQADGVTHTVNGTAATVLSSTYTIPAGDAQNGTAYRISSFGQGTWGSTAQALTMRSMFAGSTVGTSPVISASAIGSGATFQWRASVTLICVSSGSSGTWVASLDGTLNQTANAILPGTAADNVVSFTGCTTSTVTQDTTIANTLAVGASWASATGTPTLSSVGTLFEKVN